MTTPHPHDGPLTPDPATDHIHGSAHAAVTLVEYGDFECPSCRQAHPAVKFLVSHFGDRLRFVYRHFPLREVHPHAEIAAEASEAAAAQHQFWPFHDLLFEHQGHLDLKHFLGYARQLGLDPVRFENEMKDNVYLQRVQEQIASGTRVGVRATPSFFVNRTFVDVSFGLERLETAIDAALAKDSQS